ncbi:MAG: hypothetical protein ACK4NE_01200 [Albidovulum sp.]
MRDRPVPFQQGSLDALCGVYALVNAVSYLCPALDGCDARTLFARLLRKIGRVRRKALKSLREGLTLSQVRRLLKVARKRVERRFDVRLCVQRIRHKVRDAPQLSSLWRELRRRLGSGSVAIVGIGGLEAHWSVAIRAGRTWLKLIDSDGLAALKRSTCAVVPCTRRFVLDPGEILIIRRVKTKT